MLGRGEHEPECLTAPRPKYILVTTALKFGQVDLAVRGAEDDAVILTEGKLMVKMSRCRSGFLLLDPSTDRKFPHSGAASPSRRLYRPSTKTLVPAFRGTWWVCGTHLTLKKGIGN